MTRYFVLLLLVACSTDDPVEEPCGGVRNGTIAHCIPFPDDPPKRPITVQWEFYPSVGGPASTTCPAGVANVELHASDGGFATFACATRLGRIDTAFGERWLARLVAANGAVIAESVPAVASESMAYARFYEDGGFARVHWRVQSDGGPLHMKCLDAEPLRITILSAGTQVTSQGYPCPRSSFMVVSDALREGSYTFMFEGLNGSETRTIAIGRNNAITDVDVTTP